jgi:hypothetical protein
MPNQEQEKTVFGYELQEGERFVTGDEFAGVLVFYLDQPTKMVYPDGRVASFTTAKFLAD